MVTLIGTEDDTRALLSNLVQFERDTIATYDGVIAQLESFENQQQIRRFRSDHQAHLKDLEVLAAHHGACIPQSPGVRTPIATGTVDLANRFSADAATLGAMSTYETDTVAAYRNACANAHTPEDATDVLESALADEERHKAWMEDAARAQGSGS